MLSRALCFAPRLTCLSLALFSGLALAGPALALGPLSFDKSWTEQTFPRRTANKFALSGNTLGLRSDKGVSLVWRALPQPFHGATRADWGWSVTETVPATDLAKKGGDDRNLAVYFVFLPPERAAAAARANIRQLLSDKQARVLVYVWGGDAARGAVLPSPYLDQRGKTVVLRPAGTGQHRESVDLAADYRRAFGAAPGAVVGVAVSGDSDDSASTIRASLTGLSLR